MKRGNRKSEGKIEVTEGTTNVFADLGYPDAAERQAKVRLARLLQNILKAHKLKQRELAKILGVPQPKVSALLNYRLDGFSVEKLIEFIAALSHNVDIVVHERSARRGAGKI